MAENSPQKPVEGVPVPQLQYRNLALIGAGLVGLWVMAIVSRSQAAMVVLGVITLTLLGGAIYVWRMFKKQQEVVALMQRSAESPEARKKVLAELDASAGDDVMKLLAKANLEAQDDPDKALKTLEAIDIEKVPVMMADDVRMFRAQLYLLKNRVNDAADLADKIQLSRPQQQPESRGMMVATVAEAWARVGKHKEALDLLAATSPDDDTFGKARLPLLFARIFGNHYAGRRELVRKDLITLTKIEVNALGRFLDPRFDVPQEIQRTAREVAERSPEVQAAVSQQVPQNREQRRAMARKQR